MEFHLTGKNTFLDVVREMARDEVRAEVRDEVRAEVRAEVLESCQIDQGRKDVLLVLEQRLGPPDPAVVQAIQSVKDVAVLSALLKYATVAPTLEDFQGRLRALEA